MIKYRVKLRHNIFYNRYGVQAKFKWLPFWVRVVALYSKAEADEYIEMIRDVK